MQCTGVGCGLGLRAEELPTVRRMPPLVLLPLVLLALLLLPRQLHADRIFWADSNRVGSLHDAVERAAEFGSTGATVRLGPGRHILTHPLLLDHRHSGLHFVGGGSASVSGAIEIGGPSAPPNGSTSVAGWSVVGVAKCLGCTEIWRAAIPRGADSRQLYINGRRANRTWVGFPPEGNKSKWGTTITVPGTRLQRWRHNVSSIEVVYRGASSAGSQWTESRCPVAAITNGGGTNEALAELPVYDCVADYCADDVCPDCTSMPDHNCLPPGEGTVNKTGPATMGAVCPKELPTCRNYLANHHWGTCFPAVHYAPCSADYCAKSACPARGAQGGFVRKNFSHANLSAVCPKQLPFCDGNFAADHRGTCKATPPEGSGSTTVHVEPQCARTGNAKGQPLSIPAYIENAFEILGSLDGQPGQFFLDSYAGFVYYVPQPGEAPHDTIGHLPLVSQLIIASGVEDTVYEGIAFEHSTWMTPSSKGGFVENQAGQYNICQYNCTPGSSSGATGKCNTNCTREHNIPGALQFFGAKDCAFNDCTFQHIGSVGLSFTGGSHGNRVSRCKFYDISASAIYIGALEVSASNLHNISQQDINNTVSDSVISHVSREFRGSPGIFIGISHGTELTHNEISFCPYSAVSVGWGWASYPYSFGGANNISGNHIHHHMQLLGDVSQAARTL